MDGIARDGPTGISIRGYNVGQTDEIERWLKQGVTFNLGSQTAFNAAERKNLDLIAALEKERDEAKAKGDPSLAGFIADRDEHAQQLRVEIELFRRRLLTKPTFTVRDEIPA